MIGTQYFVQEFDAFPAMYPSLPVMSFLFENNLSMDECMEYLEVDRECAEVISVNGELFVRCEVCNAFVNVLRHGVVEEMCLYDWIVHKFECAGTRFGLNFGYVYNFIILKIGFVWPGVLCFMSIC